MRLHNYETLIREILDHNNALLFLSEFIDAFDELDPAVRKSLDLKYNHDYQLRQIANEMQISLTKATRLIHTGKSQLRRKLNPEYYQQTAAHFIKLRAI